MRDPAAEYQSAVAGIEEAHKEALRAFADWFAKEWQSSREQWQKEFAEPAPKGDWFDGWNAGVASVTDALDVFLGDFHP